VGENGFQGPATVQDAKQYETSHSYTAPISVVSDPKWQKIGTAVNHGGSTISLPFMIVFDADMTIKYSGSDINQVVQIIATETGVPYTGGGGGGPGNASCEGSCGGQAADCWCDDKCSQYGDCCADICEGCGRGC